MPSLSPQERSRLSFFKAGPHFLPTFLTSGNLAGSFPEPSVSHRGHGSPPPTAFTARHPTDAEWSLAGTTAQASGRPQPGAGPSHARGAQASTGSRPLKPPSLVKFHDSFSLKKKKKSLFENKQKSQSWDSEELASLQLPVLFVSFSCLASQGTGETVLSSHFTDR